MALHASHPPSPEPHPPAPPTHAPKTGETHRTQDSLWAQIKDADRSTAITEAASLRDIQWGNYLRHKRAMTLVVVVTAIVALLVFVYWSLDKLSRDYVGAYRWWNDPLGFNNTQKTPYPNGIYPTMTVPTVAVAASYPGVAWMQGLLFKSTTPTRNGCIFLLKMASQYGYWVDGPFKGNARLRGIHWNGSSDQLRFTSIHQFLPLDAPSKYGTGASINWGYVWASWNRMAEGGEGYANPWAYVIWTDMTSFSQSPMITGYYAEDATYTSFVTSLFSGGLCAVAMDWFTAKTDPDQVIDEMIGYVSSSKARPCSTAAVASSAIQYGSLGFSVLAGIGCVFDPLIAIGLGLFGGGAGAVLGATVMKPTNCGSVKTAGGE